MEEELSGYEILDLRAGKGSTCFGKGPLLGDSDDFVYEIAWWKSLLWTKVSKPERFSRGKIPLHYKQCKSRAVLFFTYVSPRP